MIETQREQARSPDDPARYDELSPAQCQVLALWIAYAVEPSPRVDSHSSYAIKHDFGECAGFYVTNGQFKAALRYAGYEPIDEQARSWRFRIRPQLKPRQRWNTNAGYCLDHLSPAQKQQLRALLEPAR